MARKSANKPNRAKAGRRTEEAVKIVALLVFIFIGLGIIAGSIWYYGFFQPRAEQEITEVAASFAKEFFTVEYSAITGQEGKDFMTDSQAEKVLAGGRVSAWKEQELAIQVEGDVEVRILEQHLRTAVVRAVFWQHEEAKGQDGKEYLIYYDFDLVRTHGRWLVDKIRVANAEELETLRQNKGVLEEPNGETE
ncbi:MAG: hypothetical protein PHD92_07565 [Eubacteriales bacterium]|nr:hypothetical protein [Eubacteriales bacterium]